MVISAAIESTGVIEARIYVGGIVGYVDGDLSVNGVVTRSGTTVPLASSYGECVGGIAGFVGGEFSNVTTIFNGGDVWAIDSAGGMVGHVIIASLAAYPLAKHNFPGKKILFQLVVLSMMFSWTVTQTPQYMIISWLGINNSYWALILPACAFGMGLYLMKQFMEQLPDSLMESARLDGASEFRIFWTIVMPNVKPAWLTLAIFQFQQMWSNTGGTFLRDEQLKPLQYALYQISAGGAARAGAGAAVTFIIAAVPITFFLICQSNVLETMTSSGMKE
jgi:ABC-type glycerol-3-phosphate transport system permease component